MTEHEIAREAAEKFCNTFIPPLSPETKEELSAIIFEAIQSANKMLFTQQEHDERVRAEMKQTEVVLRGQLEAIQSARESRDGETSDDTRTELTTDQKEVLSLRQQLTSLQRENAANKKQLEYMTEIADMVATDLENEVGNHHTMANLLRESISEESIDKLSSLRAENETLKQTNVTLRSKDNKWRESNGELISEQESLRAENQKLLLNQSSWEASGRVIAARDATIESLRAELEKVRGTNSEIVYSIRNAIGTTSIIFSGDLKEFVLSIFGTVITERDGWKELSTEQSKLISKMNASLTNKGEK